jgi:hypothetical protein
MATRRDPPESDPVLAQLDRIRACHWLLGEIHDDTLRGTSEAMEDWLEEMAIQTLGEAIRDLEKDY